jgi:DNA-binding transcriptional MerR regulator
MEDNIFSGIPSLDDAQGLEQFMTNSQAEDFGFNNQMPAALQQQDPPTPAAEPPVQQEATPTPAAPTFTSEQVAQIVARLQASNQNTQPAQRQPLPNRTVQQSTYTPQQAQAIKRFIDAGVPLEKIIASLNGNRQQNAAQQQVLSRLQGIEQYLQNQQYKAEEANFINKMTTFGDKFGLSESDLVTFGNQALSMGINLANVTDVEAVFRAVYPEQYAIRSQRIAGASASQIYGGASAMETPRAASSKLEDAYVDAFLKQAMPNAYGMHTK